jgi:hypothetical protein
MIKSSLERRLVEWDKLEGSVGGNQTLMEERRKTKKEWQNIAFAEERSAWLKAKC